MTNLRLFLASFSVGPEADTPLSGSFAIKASLSELNLTLKFVEIKEFCGAIPPPSSG